MPPSNPSGSKKSQSQVAGTRGGSGNVIRVFNFEKTERRAKKVRHRPVENLVRRAGGIKATMAGVKYSQFEPLYELWCGYFAKLLEEVTSKGTGRLDDRILRADYQGCLLRVADAPNPTQVGLNGIVVRESKQTFEMVTRLDKIIVIPKEAATFQFVYQCKVYTLYGDALRQKTHLRGKKQKWGEMRLPYFLK